MEKYRFTEKGHRHEFLVNGEWKKMTGVTTIVLGAIANPQLIQWAVNMAINCFKKNKARLLKEFDTICEKAKKAYIKERDKAGKAGTEIHAIIEEIIKGAIKNNNRVILPKAYEGNKQIKHFLDWALKNKVKFLSSEEHIYSEKLFIGGICDFVCEIDGETWIGDVKTGSRIYAEAFIQIGGYDILFQEMGKYPNIKGYIVLNLKKDGTFKEVRVISKEDCQRLFLSHLTIDRGKAKIESLIN